MLIFIDESGHPNPKDNTSKPVILAVCIAETDVGRLTRTMFAMKRNLLGKMHLTKAEVEGKAAVMLNRRSLAKSVAKREYMEAVFDYLRDFDLTTFAIVMERPSKAPYSGPSYLQTQHQWLLQRIDRFMERDHPKYMAIPVFDGQDPTNNRRFADCFTSFMARHSTGRAMQHIVPSPLFVDSFLTPGVQIADLFAYVVRLDFEYGLHQTSMLTDPYLSAIKRFASIVRGKTINYEREDGNGTWSGISTMDATRFVYERPVGLPTDEMPIEPDETVAGEEVTQASPASPDPSDPPLG